MTAEMSNAAWKGLVDEVHCVLSSMQRVPKSSDLEELEYLQKAV
jgi:hypothetical protein